MREILRKLVYDIRSKGLGHVAGRYYGTYMAQVTNTEDPEKKGRIQVAGPIFPGSKPTKAQGYKIWIPPKAMITGNASGAFFPPQPNDFVFILFVDGNYEKPYYDGGYWNKVTVEPFTDIQTIPPTISGIKTSTGHRLIFSEDEENSYITIKTKGENELLFEDNNGIVIKDNNGNSITTTEEGISIADKNGNSITMGSDGVKINDQFVVREEFLAWLDENKNSIGMGNMGAPVQLFPTALTVFVQKFKSIKDKFLSNK